VEKGNDGSADASRPRRLDLGPKCQFWIDSDGWLNLFDGYASVGFDADETEALRKFLAEGPAKPEPTPAKPLFDGADIYTLNRWSIEQPMDVRSQCWTRLQPLIDWAIEFPIPADAYSIEIAHSAIYRAALRGWKHGRRNQDHGAQEIADELIKEVAGFPSHPPKQGDQV